MRKLFICLLIVSATRISFAVHSGDIIYGCNAGFTYAITDSLMIYLNGYELFLRSDCRDDSVYHKWELSNGLISDEKDPIFTINPADSVLEVCHKVIDKSGILDSYCELITYMYQPVSECLADFTFYRDSTANCNCVDAYQFIDQSTDDAVGWSWSFGDGETSQQQNPLHNYDTAGFFPVELEIATAEGCKSMMRKFILVRGDIECHLKIESLVLGSYPPEYQFQSNLYDPRLPYSFIPTPDETSWFEIIRYYWDFGDGSYSTDPFPTHVYNSSGTYTVSLRITYADGFTCKSYLTDYFQGANQHTGCEYYGTFHRNYQKSGFDVIFQDDGHMFYVIQTVPEIYLPDVSRINFSYAMIADTVFIGIERFSSIIVTCVGLIDADCSLTGTVRDYTGLDGCGFLIELDNGLRLEPILQDTTFHFRDNQRVRLSYIKRPDLMSICMAGIIAEITCIKEIESEIIVPPEYCEQIMLTTSFSINGGTCNGTASVEIVTPCSAWMWYEMILTTDYRILWSTGETTRTITGLCPGDLYFVNVTNPVTGKTYTAAFSIFRLNNVFPSWTFTRNDNTYWFNLQVDDTCTVTWNFDNEISLVGEDVSYTFNSSGDHQVELVVKDQAGSEVYTETIQLTLPTINMEQHLESVTVFPNPADDVLHINMGAGSESLTIAIYNFSGQMLIKEKYSHVVSGDLISLDVSDLNAGIYLLVINNQNKGSLPVKFEKH
ncbi:MAG: PKD domain-containing protein [Bacteroidales bacterium]|nr:PKD domain-containing protein [Bacteroidales bacterium]